jgi:hypothetical protein
MKTTKSDDQKITRNETSYIQRETMLYSSMFLFIFWSSLLAFNKLRIISCMMISPGIMTVQYCTSVFARSRKMTRHDYAQR